MEQLGYQIASCLEAASRVAMAMTYNSFLSCTTLTEQQLPIGDTHELSSRSHFWVSVTAFGKDGLWSLCVCVLCSCVSKKLSMYLHRLCIAVKLTRLRYPKCIHLSLGIILVSNIPIPTQRLMLVVKFGFFFLREVALYCLLQRCALQDWASWNLAF